MNGQFIPEAADRGSLSAHRAAWSEDPDSAPLLAALALSCLLHAAVVFLPFLGKSAKETRFAPAGRLQPPRILNATLAIAAEHKFSAANVPARTEALPDPSAEDRPAAAAQPASERRAEGIGLLPLPAPVYYTPDQLSKGPQPLVAADLDAPDIRPIVASGKIVLKLWINQFGAVADVVVEKSDLPAIFARTAVEAFRGMRFTPGELNGQPVGTVMRIEVTYADGRLP